jgi:hypothetical protein
MKFPYLRQPSSLNPSLPYIARPLIPIRLSLKAMHLETYALLDSGADRSVFNSRFANELLIDLEYGKKELYFGIGAQPVAVYHHKINIQLIGSQDSIEVEVGFTEAPGVDAILGQADFFEHHQIKFERSKESMEIKPLIQTAKTKPD